MTDLIVHGGLPSPFVRKVLLCLEEKELAYELRPLSPMPKTPELLALNPFGRIPILQHGDFTLPDSSAIVLYLERIAPSPALFPSEPRDYGRALFLEEYADTKIVIGTSAALFHGLIRPMFFQQPGDMAAVDKAIAEELVPALDWLEPRVDAPTGIIRGRYSIADIAVATQLMGLPYAKRELDRARWPRIAAWYATTRARPAWQRIAPREFPVPA
jgi:glutathione S-transferase